MPADLTAICPAFTCAAEVIRLEAEIEHMARLIDEAQCASAPDILQNLETVLADLLLAAEAARDRLAAAAPLSSAGAMAQLLAAIRDIRVQDDDERGRARDLEAKAVRFAVEAGLYDARFCRSLSSTRLGGRMHVAPPVDARQTSSRSRTDVTQPCAAPA